VDPIAFDPEYPVDAVVPTEKPAPLAS